MPRTAKGMIRDLYIGADSNGRKFYARVEMVRDTQDDPRIVVDGTVVRAGGKLANIGDVVDCGHAVDYSGVLVPNVQGGWQMGEVLRFADIAARCNYKQLTAPDDLTADELVFIYRQFGLVAD